MMTIREYMKVYKRINKVMADFNNALVLVKNTSANQTDLLITYANNVAKLGRKVKRLADCANVTVVTLVEHATAGEDAFIMWAYNNNVTFANDPDDATENTAE